MLKSNNRKIRRNKGKARRRGTKGELVLLNVWREGREEDTSLKERKNRLNRK